MNKQGKRKPGAIGDTLSGKLIMINIKQRHIHESAIWTFGAL